jgi:hypothetical protein
VLRERLAALLLLIVLAAYVVARGVVPTLPHIEV